jgi:hypothetical protein
MPRERLSLRKSLKNCLRYSIQTTETMLLRFAKNSILKLSRL